MLDLKRLAVFRQVARRRSFSAAAQDLNYSQPAVSHHVARLELELGIRLFERGSSEGVTLTTAGKALLDHADALLDRAEEAESELAALIGAELAVRVGAFATASATIVVEAVADVHKSWPHLPVALLEAETDESLHALRRRRIEIAVVFDDPRYPVHADEIECRYLIDDPMLVAMPGNHRMARRPVLTLGDLREESWIEGAGAETPCSLILIASCEDAGFEPRVVFNTGNFEVVQELVAANIGIALVPRLAIRRPPPQGLIFRELSPTPPFRRIALATRQNSRLNPAAHAMLTALEDACRRWGDRLAGPASGAGAVRDLPRPDSAHVAPSARPLRIQRT